MDEKRVQRVLERKHALERIPHHQWTNAQLREAQDLIAEVTQMKREDDRLAMRRQLESLGNAGDVADARRQRPGTESGGLWGAIQSQGFNVKTNPTVIVSPAEALGVKAA